MGTEDPRKTQKKRRETPPLGRLVPWGKVISQVTRPLFKKGGLGMGAIISDWDYIVGATYGKVSLPERLSFQGQERTQGVLKVRVHGPAALALQHQEGVILERINQYFGYKAVSQLRLFQGPMPSRPLIPVAPVPVVDPQVEATLLTQLEGKWKGTEEEDPLRDVLAKLARDLSTR